MSVCDPIADALTKIRNAYRAGHTQVIVNHNRLTESIVKILAEENFINSYQIIERDPAKKIERRKITLNLRYTNNGQPVLRGIQRISKPGRRVYVKSDNLPSVYNHIGCAIITSSRGVLVDRDARAANIGGEYVCKVW
jgi:small subunit ribosomal protein S8